MAGVFGVFAHDLCGALGVVGFDGLDQRGVFGPGLLASGVGDGGVVPADSPLDLGGELDEDPVAAGVGDGGV